VRTAGTTATSDDVSDGGVAQCCPVEDRVPRLLGRELPLSKCKPLVLGARAHFLPPAIATFLLVGCRKARWLRCIAAMPRRSYEYEWECERANVEAGRDR